MLTEKELNEVLSIELRDRSGNPFDLIERYKNQIINNFKSHLLCEINLEEQLGDE